MRDPDKIQCNSSSCKCSSALYKIAPVFYIFIVLVIAAILAPALSALFSHWFTIPFSRYVNRALMISALLALVPYLIRHWKTTGILWRSDSLNDLRNGLLISLGSVVVILAFHLWFGSRMWEPNPDKVIATLLGALLAAVLVSPLEELLFRGVIQKAMIDRMGSTVGWLVAGFFYAIVHFVKVPREFRPDPITWHSGFDSLALALAPLGKLDTYGSSLFCLLAVGLILGLLFHRTGSLWLPIGMHAGWIIGLKLGSKLTIPAPFAPAFSSDSDLLSSGMTLVLLALLGLLLWKFFRREGKRLFDGN